MKFDKTTIVILHGKLLRHRAGMSPIKNHQFFYNIYTSITARGTNSCGKTDKRNILGMIYECNGSDVIDAIVFDWACT